MSRGGDLCLASSSCDRNQFLKDCQETGREPSDANQHAYAQLPRTTRYISSFVA